MPFKSELHFDKIFALLYCLRNLFMDQFGTSIQHTLTCSVCVKWASLWHYSHCRGGNAKAQRKMRVAHSHTATKFGFAPIKSFDLWAPDYLKVTCRLLPESTWNGSTHHPSLLLRILSPLSSQNAKVAAFRVPLNEVFNERPLTLWPSLCN